MGPWSHAGPVGGPSAVLLVEGQDLELGGEVDLAQRHLGGDNDHGGGEVQDRGDAGGHQPVRDRLGGGGGVAITPIATRRSATMRLSASTGSMVSSPTVFAHFGRVGVDEGHDAEPPGAEPPVVGERPAEVPQAEDRDRPVAGQAQLPGHLADEVLDVVADPRVP